jgi:hypothetical protein
VEQKEREKEEEKGRERKRKEEKEGFESDEQIWGIVSLLGNSTLDVYSPDILEKARTLLTSLGN